MALPQEAIEEIVDHLHKDRATLMACSIASSIFLPSARYHLFSEMVIDCSSLSTFLRLLDVPWCSIAQAIWQLDIHNKKKYATHKLKCSHEHYAPVDRARIVRRLQGIKRISFSHMSLDSFPPPFWHLLHDLKGVTELNIYHVTERTPFHLFRYASSLPALEALSITQSQLQPTDSDVDRFCPKELFHIPILDISGLPHSILEWLLAQNPIIGTLHVYLDGPAAEVLKVCHYTTKLGPLVNNLCVHLPFNIETYNKSTYTVDFGSFTAIESICFEGCIGQEPEALEKLLRTLFSQIPSAALSRVSMSVGLDLASEWASLGDIPDGMLFPMFNWGRLPEILHQEIRNSLRELRIAIKTYSSCYSQEAEQSLRMGPFKEFHLRGIFHVDFPATHD